MLRRRAVGVTALLVVLVLLGAGVAQGLTAALGISSTAKTVPVERLTPAPARDVVLPPQLVSVTAPDDERTRLALGELRAAVAEAEDDAGRTGGRLALTVRHGRGDPDDDSYRLGGSASDLTVTAGSLTGAVRGVYDLAAKVRDGRSVATDLGRRVTSRLPFRMVDLGAAGVTPEPAVWREGTDYSHNSGAFADVVLTGEPYVDPAALARARASVETYARHVLAEGYNAIAVPGLLEYLTFDDVGVYDAGDPHVARARAMRAAFGPIWERLHDLGLKVYFRTDMLALTTPLESYLRGRFGSLDTERAALWKVYAAGLDELYDEMPYVDGTLIRIGEAGTIYDQPGWDYYSALGVTTVPAVRAMLTAFTRQAERADKEVVFRTWSVGVGGVGDMHTDRASYDAVLGGIDSDHLVVSTKYSLGDFYSHLPLNDTLETGGQRRIVELQSRREFEAYGSLPNDLGDLYRQALQRFTAANPRVEGIWTWTQDGGPWRAGPLTLELTTGFWQLYELNTMLAVRLARDPDADPAEITADWVRRYLSDDPATVRALGEVMALSRQAITQGLYVGPFADREVAAIGLHPPPMMWIFEWDILTGDSAVLDVIYAVSRDAGRLDRAIAEGRAAVATAKRMRTLADRPDGTWKDRTLQVALLRTLDFQVDLFAMLAAYRETFLRHAQWVDTGSGTAERQWRAAEKRFRTLAAAHEQEYGDDLDTPAYNLTAARIGLDRSDRDPAMARLATGLLVLVVGWLGVGALSRHPRDGVRRAARATWLAGTRPWRAAEAVAGLDRPGKALVLGVPVVALVLSRGVLTWFAAPAHWAITGLAWTVFALALLVAARIGRRDPWAVAAAVGGAVLLRVLVLLVALRARGPGGYWFAFWTEPGERTAYVVVAFTAFAWVLVAAAWSLRSVAAVLAASGLVLVAGGLLVGGIGLEQALTTWNDQMALLPWGLSRILGITVYLGIPTALPWWVAGLGAVLLLGGLTPPGWRRRPGRRTPRAAR